jgi:hypothetical protein
LEAQQIYEAIVNEGWQAALELQRLRRRGGAAVRADAGAAPLLKSDLAYWEHRLIQRRYREARLRAGAEFSARIEHEGTHAYFPLGTDDPKGAAATAREIYQTVVGSGWAAAFTRFERELTLAISWSDNPLAITYATLFTFLTTPAPAAPPARATGGSNTRSSCSNPMSRPTRACAIGWTASRALPAALCTAPPPKPLKPSNWRRTPRPCWCC